MLASLAALASPRVLGTGALADVGGDLWNRFAAYPDLPAVSGIPSETLRTAVTNMAVEMMRADGVVVDEGPYWTLARAYILDLAAYDPTLVSVVAYLSWGSVPWTLNGAPFDGTLVPGKTLPSFWPDVAAKLADVTPAPPGPPSPGTTWQASLTVGFVPGSSRSVKNFPWKDIPWAFVPWDKVPWSAVRPLLGKYHPLTAQTLASLSREMLAPDRCPGCGACPPCPAGQVPAPGSAPGGCICQAASSGSGPCPSPCPPGQSRVPGSCMCWAPAPAPGPCAPCPPGEAHLAGSCLCHPIVLPIPLPAPPAPPAPKPAPSGGGGFGTFLGWTLVFGTAVGLTVLATRGIERDGKGE